MPTNLQYVIAATIMIAHLSVKVPSAVIRSLTLTVATCSHLCNRTRRVKDKPSRGRGGNAHSSCLIDFEEKF